MDKEIQNMYQKTFMDYLEKGDDPLNARLRIIEQGCPIEIATKIELDYYDKYDDEFDEDIN